MSTEVLLNEFKEYSEHPHRVLSQYKQEGKKVIGVLPYYAPVELVVAAGMVPMGIWGSNKKTIALAKEYCATFYCTIGQLALEMLLDGTLDQLDGIITPTIHHHPHHLRHPAPHEPELPRGHGGQAALHLPGSPSEP